MNNSYSNTLESPSSALLDKLEDFIIKLFKKSPRQRYGFLSLPIDPVDPLSFLERSWNNADFHYYWENPSDEFAIAAGEKMLTLTASGKDRFQQINRQIKAVQKASSECSFPDHPYSGLMFLGGFSFFDTISADTWKSFKPASFTVPKWMIIRDSQTHLLTLSFDLKTFPSPERLQKYLLQKIEEVNNFIAVNPAGTMTGRNKACSSENSLLRSHDLEYSNWVASVKKAKRRISQNIYKKVVLARHIARATDSHTSPVQIINRLRRQYENCYNFLIHNPDGGTFVGSTPERLASFSHNSLKTEALAGSIQRGQTSAEDAMFEQDLTVSSKEQREHNFVVKDIQNRLKPFVDHFGMNQQPEIRKLANVQHLYTPIRASLKSNVDILSVIEQLHPTPAVGGFPRQDAVPFIKKLEDFERGWYASPVGWLNTKGRGEFGVAIRSGLLTDSAAHFYAGCGIVAESDPYDEWEETHLKFQPMLSAL